ncbi:hypothetical protein [Methylopila sp. M107]|uniref:hypothetical protein n=1 Tax=Methylopila sp. M107 TaxID=1101190 RepID=UPI0003645E37|nr:hypothetical protein [Methylopila sp. M107]
MTTILSRGRKIVAATLVAAAAIGAVAVPTSSAEARGWRHHHGYGYGAAALGGGLLLGAIIASNNRGYGYARDCWVERRRGYDAYGYPVVRRIRVCD